MPVTLLSASLWRAQYAWLLLQGHGHHRGPRSSVFYQLLPLACFPWPRAAVSHAEVCMRFTSVWEALSHLFVNADLLLGTGCVCRCWLWTGLEKVWKHVMVSLTETAMRKCLGCCSAPWEMCCARNCSTPVLTMFICATLSSPHTGKTDFLNVSLY